MISPTRRTLLMAGLGLAVLSPVLAADPPSPPIRLFVGAAPGEQGPIEAEQHTLPPAGSKGGIHKIINVSEPALSVFAAPREKANGTALIVAPGGGYSFLSWDLEGTEIARRFNQEGATVFVLKYRVPKRSFDPTNRLPLMDAQRAISLVRHRAKEWGIEVNRIGFLGFSAGGHLAAHVSTNSDQRAYSATDAVDAVGCRPDFAVLIYPGGLLDKADPAKLAKEMRVSAETPRSFIAVAGDDKGCLDPSIRYYSALRAAGVSAELHVYAGGGHGFGLRERAGTAATWPDRCADWMRASGLLAASK